MTRFSSIRERQTARIAFKLFLRVSAVAFAATRVAPLCAQIHKVAAPETVTRAVAVYEWTGELTKPTAERLVPVSLYIDGRLEDAGTYYSRPIPLALLNGNVYTLETTGLPQGNVTIDYARHLQTATSAGGGDQTDLGWFGYGNFVPPPPPPKQAPAHPSSTLSEIVGSKHDSDPDRPTFAHRPAPDADTRTPAATSSTSSPAPSTPDDPDRPHIGKAPSTASTSPADPAPAKPTTADSGSSTPPKEPESDPDRPTLRHRDPKQAEADRKARDKSGVSAAGAGIGSDPDRPVMRRGQPADAAAAAPQMSGIPAGLQQKVAVSDAVDRENHAFARAWDSPAEQAETQKAMAATAKRAMKKYAAANALHFAAEPAAHDHKSNRKGAPKTAPDPEEDKLGLKNEQLAGYTLSYGGLPTFVYSAIGASDNMGAEIYATVVAQKLPSGELQVALTSLTDSTHLDRTPWLRFIDAVDPDGGHRASLLFELRGHSSRQFALYRVIAANADQIFVTHQGD